MAERILIPLDGSKMGEAALHYVEETVSRLAPGEKVEVTLFHVITETVRHIDAHGLTLEVPCTEAETEQAKKEALEYLDKAGEGLRSKGAIVKCEVGVSDRAADEIIKAEGEVNADLVAMSTHGRHGISRWAFGSVTDKVLRGGSVPVLMVRAKGKGTVKS